MSNRFISTQELAKSMSKDLSNARREYLRECISKYKGNRVMVRFSMRLFDSFLNATLNSWSSRMFHG